jgi:flagellar hook-associated protein 1
MGISSLSIALSGLRAAQTQIETISHNVANAGTPGYTRQRVDLRPTAPRTTLYGPMGAGVDITGISRSTDAYVDGRARATSASAAQLEVRSELGQRTEDVMAEPDNGITSTLKGLWSSFSNLAAQPADAPRGTQVIASLGDLAGRINAVRTGIDDLSGNALARLQAELDTANAAADRIAKLNEIAPTGLAPDLQDQRDLAVDQLAKSLGGVAMVQADGKYRVTVNGMSIVDGDHVSHLTLDPLNPGVVLHPAGPITVGGTAGGLQSAILKDLPGYRARVDAFVTSLVNGLNAQHAANRTAAGVAGGPLLADDGKTVSVLVTSYSQLASADTTGGTQNGQGAVAMFSLRSTLDPAAAAMVTGIGGEVANVTRSSSSASALAEGAAQARLAVNGVNLDEEMAQMITSQKAYAAAARIVTTVDQMLDTLIRM